MSTQVRELERSLGYVLLKPAGRGVALTEAGVATMRQGEQIFQLGEPLPALMQPVMLEPNLRLLCHEHEREFEDLLGELALHRINVVLADRTAPPNPNLKLYSHSLGTSTLSWYAPASLLAAAQAEFPQSLASVSVLLPTTHTAVRARLDLWFERLAIQPKIVGEFEDNALLKTFGAAGMGVFPATEKVHDELTSRYGVKRLGACEGVEEHYFAIAAHKKVLHPLVQKLLSGQPWELAFHAAWRFVDTFSLLLIQ